MQHLFVQHIHILYVTPCENHVEHLSRKCLGDYFILVCCMQRFPFKSCKKLSKVSLSANYFTDMESSTHFARTRGVLFRKKTGHMLHT